MERRAKKASAAGMRLARASQGNGSRGASATPSVGVPTAPVRKASRTLTTDLFEQIRSDILHNRLEPGSRLLFRDMRERYHSGLSPLREALMRLVSEGLVRLEDHKGFASRRSRVKEMIDIGNTLLELEAIAIRMAVEKGDDQVGGADRRAIPRTVETRDVCRRRHAGYRMGGTQRGVPRGALRGVRVAVAEVRATCCTNGTRAIAG